MSYPGFDLINSPVLLPSVARTATVNGTDQNGRRFGVHVIINVTAATATPSVVFRIQGKDPASANYYDILVSVAVTAIGVTVLKVFPGATVAANLAANDMLPAIWRVRAEHGDTDSITYTVSANYGG